MSAAVTFTEREYWDIYLAAARREDIASKRLGRDAALFRRSALLSSDSGFDALTLFDRYTAETYADYLEARLAERELRDAHEELVTA